MSTEPREKEVGVHHPMGGRNAGGHLKKKVVGGERIAGGLVKIPANQRW